MPCSTVFPKYDLKSMFQPGLLKCCDHNRSFSPPYDMEDLKERIDEHTELDRVKMAKQKRMYKILPTVFASGEQRNCFLAVDMYSGRKLQVCVSGFQQ